MRGDIVIMNMACTGVHKLSHAHIIKTVTVNVNKPLTARLTTWCSSWPMPLLTWQRYLPAALGDALGRTREPLGARTTPSEREASGNSSRNSPGLEAGKQRYELEGLAFWECPAEICK